LLWPLNGKRRIVTLSSALLLSIDGMTKSTGIFCVEGEWGTSLKDRTSVEGHLRLLEHRRFTHDVIHRDVATVTELNQYLERWLRPRYKSYSFGYLAFHGSRGAVQLGEQTVTLEEVATTLGGRAEGRTIYFGSCSTLAGPEQRLIDFCVDSGARAVVGYTKSVDWVESAAFDLLLVPALLEYRSAKVVFNRIVRDQRTFARRLGLRMATKEWCSPTIKATKLE